MRFFRAFLRKNFPHVFHHLRELYYSILGLLGRQSKVNIIFSRIYYSNNWGDRESVSGPGSNLYNTENLRRELPVILQKLKVKSLLDIPCGDFFWMKEIQLPLDIYIGADIVRELIEKNTKLYSNEKINFVIRDLTKDRLPETDAVFCRDCFPHLSFRLIKSAIKNIKSSGSDFLFTSTYVNTAENRDIFTGGFRMINLQLPPFMFPEPEAIINDKCVIGEVVLEDKRIGIWRISEIPDF